MLVMLLRYRNFYRYDRYVVKLTEKKMLFSGQTISNKFMIEMRINLLNALKQLIILAVIKVRLQSKSQH